MAEKLSDNPQNLSAIINHAAHIHGGGAEYELINTGAHCSVVVVHDAPQPYVLKVPKTKPLEASQDLSAEFDILVRLNDTTPRSPAHYS